MTLSGTASAWPASAPSCGTGSTRSPPATAMTGPPATGPGRAAAGWRRSCCPRRRGRSSPTAWRSPAGLAPLIDRIDWELHQHARTGPRVKTLRTLPGVRGVHRAGHGGRDRRHHPVPQRPQAGLLGRADPGRARLGPEDPARHISKQGSPGCGGHSTRPRRLPSGPRSSPPATPPSPSAAVRRSPPSRSPASW
jgi:hypothetical protein